MEWWDTKGDHFKSPSEHLFKLLHINPAFGQQKFKAGRGAVYILRANPKEFVMQANNDGAYLAAVKTAYENDAKAGKLILKNNFYLERGPYDIISVLDENDNRKPLVVKGPVIDLFNPELPVLAEKTVEPGEQSLLYDMKRVANKTQPKVLASASRIYEAATAGHSFSFIAKSPVNTVNSMRILLPEMPVSIKVSDDKGNVVTDIKSSWDASSNTLFLGFNNSPEGIKVDLKWR